MIDTIKLCGNTKFLIDKFNHKKSTSVPEFASQQEKKLSDLYFNDLEEKLKRISETNVPYIIVGGHFPVLSAAEHGPTQCLVDKLMPLLHKYNVSVYFSGHDHNLQHISYNYMNTQVEYIVAGANSIIKSSNKNYNLIPKDSLKFKWPNRRELIYGGFLLVEVNNQKMILNFMKADGTNLYQKSILPRKIS